MAHCGEQQYEFQELRIAWKKQLRGGGRLADGKHGAQNLPGWTMLPGAPCGAAQSQAPHHTFFSSQHPPWTLTQLL